MWYGLLIMAQHEILLFTAFVETLFSFNLIDFRVRFHFPSHIIQFINIKYRFKMTHSIIINNHNEQR